MEPPQHHLGGLVGRCRRDPGKGDVVLGGQIGRVGLQRSHPHRKGEKDLPRRRQPDIHIAQPAEVRVVDEVEAREGSGPVRSRRQKEHRHREDRREHEQDGHPHLGELFDPAGDPLGKDVDVDEQSNEKEREGDPQPVRRGVVNGLVRVQVRPHRVEGVPPPVVTAGAEPGERQRPALDQRVVRQHHQRDHQPHDPEVLRRRVLPDGREHSGDVALPVTPPVAPDPPLDPHQRNAEEHERDEVGDHEGAATVGRGLPRKAQKVAEADGVPRHRQDQADAAPPCLVRVASRGRGLCR